MEEITKINVKLNLRIEIYKKAERIARNVCILLISVTKKADIPSCFAKLQILNPTTGQEDDKIEGDCTNDEPPIIYTNLKINNVQVSQSCKLLKVFF